MITQKQTVYGKHLVKEVWNLQSANPTYNAERSYEADSLLWEIDNAVSSVNTPGFRKLKRYQLPDHPHHWHMKSWSQPNTSVELNFNYDSGRRDVNYYRGPARILGCQTDESISLYPGDDPSNQAISKLQEMVTLSQGSAGVSLAEADKTAAHLAKTAERLTTAYRQLRKGHLGDFARSLGITVRADKVRAYRNRRIRLKRSGLDLEQFAASTWLEYSYGWKPLLKDFYDQAKNLAEILTERQNVIRVARAHARTQRVYTENITRSDKLWSNLKRVVVTNSVTYIVRYRIPNGANTVGNVFGLQNPLLVAWELIPFSFVADWFLPVGDFLNQISAYDGLEFAGGVKTFKRNSEITCKTTLGSGDYVNGIRRFASNLSGGSGTNMSYYKDRTLLTQFPRKSLEFKDPRSFAHAASAIALIQSVFRGSRSFQSSYSYSNAISRLR